MNKKQRVLYVEKFDKALPPSKLMEFRDWLHTKIMEIPKEYLETATIEFDCDTSYDSSYANIEISYERPETDEEKDSREYETRQRKLQELYRAQTRVTLLMKDVGNGSQ